MTKKEAIKAMKQGKKLTHHWFSEEEWVKSNRSGMVFIFEDGVKSSADEFWKSRKEFSWDNDWEIFKK